MLSYADGRLDQAASTGDGPACPGPDPGKGTCPHPPCRQEDWGAGREPAPAIGLVPQACVGIGVTRPHFASGRVILNRLRP